MRRSVALLLFVALGASALEMHHANTYSLEPPMNTDSATWLAYGDAVLKQTHVELTTDEQSKSGSIWNPNPFNSATMAFEVDIQFNVFGSGLEYYGDGFAFWYTKEMATEGGPVFGSKDQFTGLGVFFDTYDNTGGKLKHPLVKVMVGDGHKTYADYWAPEVAANNLGYYCNAQLRSAEQNADTLRNVVRIRYDSGILTISLALLDDQSFKTCLELHDVSLPTGYHFGVSASTGALTDNHFIRKVTVLTAEASGPDAEEVTDEEMEGINTIVQDTRIVQLIKARAAKHATRLDELSSHLESQVTALRGHLEAMVTRVEEMDAQLEKRVAALEGTSVQRVSDMKEAITGGSGWRTPFFALMVVLLLGGALLYRRWRSVMKDHLM